MALKFKFKSNLGIDADDAYGHIASFRGDKVTTHLIVDIYYDENARSENAQPLRSEHVTLQLPNGATMQQMYDALKELPEFAGAVDV